MTEREQGIPVEAPAKIEVDEKFTIRAYRLKPNRSPYDFGDKNAEEPAAIIADLVARVDAVERCGIAPRLAVSDDFGTLTLYAWRKVWR